MFSFEGDFKTRPKVSLGGASKKASDVLKDRRKQIYNQPLEICLPYLTSMLINSTIKHIIVSSDCLKIFLHYLSGRESVSAAPHSRRKKKKRGK